MTNVGRLAFRGNSRTSPADVSRIICTDATLTFTNILILEITDLGFHSCTIKLDTSSALFKNSSFKNSTSMYGGAIYAHSSIITFDGQTRFASNRAAVFGGGIFAEESVLIFYGNTTFINNEAMERGGGIFMVQSDFKFAGDASFVANIVRELNSSYFGGGGIHGHNSRLDFDFGNTFTFLDNSAVTGGGLLVNYSTVSFSGVGQFISNSAEYGGGVSAWLSNVSFGDANSFINNSAEMNGGGVHVEESNVHFGDANSFIDNSAAVYGGGVCAWESTVSFGDANSFIDNSAAVYGGGVLAGETTVSFSDANSFINNTAQWGGGVYVQESNVSFGDANSFIDNSAVIDGGGVSVVESKVNFGDANVFINNSAEYGGGVDVWLSNVSFGDANSFINNSAEMNGGGVYVEESNVHFGDANSFIDNSAAVYGGGVCAWESTVNFGDTNSFIDNSAAVYGGGVLAGESTVSFSDANSFINNSAAEYGGGVFAWESTVSFGDANSFINNSAQYGGAGVYVEESNVSFDDANSFINNSAELGGGVSVVVESNVNFGDANSFVNNSAAVYGAGVLAEESNLSFGDANSFIINSAAEYGGGVVALESTVSFGDVNSFINNSAQYGGAGVYVDESNVSFDDVNNFINNTAGRHGGGVYVEESNVSFGDANSFINNSAAEYGGGVVALESTVSFGDVNSFINNSAQYGGAGVYVDESNVSFVDGNNFINNTAGWHGGGVYVEESNVSFGDANSFIDNSAEYDGGGVTAWLSNVTFGDNSRFIYNSAVWGGGVNMRYSNVRFGDSDFTGNFAGWYGGGILASKSYITFGGSQVLTNNSAGYGGAVYLTLDSKIYLLPYTTMSFESNLAKYRGGALFVEDNPINYCTIASQFILGSTDVDACFIQILEADCYPVLKERTELDHSIELRFQDNVANETGSAIYGGSLDSCGICTSLSGHNLGDFVLGKVLLDSSITSANTPSNIMSSDPYRVCICVDNHPDCNQGNTTREIFPGVTIVVPVVAFGHYNGTVPAVIQTYISKGITLGALQHTQQSNNTCTNLQYTVRSTRDITIRSKESLTLYADEPCSTLGLPLEVFLTFLPCPLGFSLSTEGSCECDQRLNKYEVVCDINDQSILRKETVWIGLDEQSDNNSQGLILHPHCPFHYCKPESDSVTFTLNTTDLQCNYNRSGHLCGACQHGFSLAVGSSRCLPCSNKFLTLLTAFVFAGLSLVVLLFICKVTVAAGTISGLIFYANIVTVNQSIFFPSGEANILTVFIAWLNLDLGIETCFFDGMDAYSMMWLQFVFPIYIWLLVGLITILCNVSITAARILGSTNPIAVLATLFLLSYTKLLRTAIAVFSFTTLEFPDDETKVVWLYDGNIEYLDKNDGRHIALFLVSLLVILFFFLPYTIFLLFGQWILPRLDLNKLKWLSWGNYLRMKSFLDANHAPYKDRHRYWIGLLLVLRFIMFLISAIIDMESPQDPHVNLVVIIISTSMLGMWVWNASGGVCKKWYLNVLESSFILNLAVLAVATYQVKLAGGNQAAVFYSSVSVAFSTFIGIIIYHVYQRLRDSRAWRNLVRKRNERRRAGDNGWQRGDAAADEKMEEMLPQIAPTVTYVDIPTDERRQMCPITPPLSPTHFTNVPLDRLQREDTVTEDDEVEEMLPQVPTVTNMPTAKAMCSLTPPPPINFTDVREPLDLLTQ